MNKYRIEPILVDLQVDKEDAKLEYGLNLVESDSIKDADCFVFAVAYDEFKQMNMN